MTARVVQRSAKVDRPGGQQEVYGPAAALVVVFGGPGAATTGAVADSVEGADGLGGGTDDRLGVGLADGDSDGVFDGSSDGVSEGLSLGSGLGVSLGD